MGGIGTAALVVHGTLALLTATGRLGLGAWATLLVLAALALGAFGGLATALGDLAMARSAALAETALWTMVLLLLGGVLADPARRAVLVLALALGAVAALVAPSAPWRTGTAAVAIIGVFLAAGIGGSQPGPPALGRRLAFWALGLGFAFDILIAGLALAGAPLAPSLEAARPLLRALLAPLAVLHLAAIARLGPGAALRPAARRTALALVATLAALLLVAAGAGWLGHWLGPALALALFLPVAALLLGLAPSAETGLEALVHRLWQRHRYDYGEVWPAFVATLAGADPQSADSQPAARQPSDDLPERVIRAVAETVGAGGGAIWLAERGGRFRPLAARGLAPAGCGVAPDLAAALLADPAPLPAVRGLPGRLPWPAFLPPPRGLWAILPLVHKGRLLGLLALGQPPQPRSLDAEDLALLELLALQAASYLAEDETVRQLADMRQFENFTRRFAYVMHDVKNIAHQLSLTLSNAKKHRGNQAFYDDMVETLEFSVDRMNGLITQLRQESNPRLDRVTLAPLLRRVAARRRDPRLTLLEPLPRITARVEAEALESALEHLIDNALEAIGSRGQVRLGLERRDHMAALIVADDGPGLPPERLAGGRRRAFASDKPGGLGLGLDQARHTVERVGGRFDLSSSPGAGTTVALCLPGLEGQPT